MANITSKIQQTFKYPNIAASYGPYQSKHTAHLALADDGLNIIGMTVGIEDSTTHTIKEWWYQGGTTENDLVEKQAAEIQVDQTVQPGSPRPVAGGAVASALEGKAPSTNIQKTALSNDVQQSLNKADNAIPSSQKGAASGVATLDESGKVPEAQLPSYVDDVLEFANLSSFPVTGESGKIYVALDTNKTYRWSGSTYVEIAQGLALGETSSTAFPGDRGKAIEDKIPSSASSSNKLVTTNDISGKVDKVVNAQENHFASFDENGGIKDSGCNESSFATAAQGELADSAYQKPQTGIPSTDLTSEVQTSLENADTAVQQVSVDPNTVTGNAGTNASVSNIGTQTNPIFKFTIPRGADAYNPFKGIYLITDTLPTTGQDGDYIYVVDSATPPVTHVYTWTGTQFQDSGETVTIGDSQFANSTKPISQTNIVNNLIDGGTEDVLSAEQGVVLEGQVNQLEAAMDGAYSVNPAVTEISDKFITTGGSIVNSNNFAYTTPFFARKGDKIIVHARGYSNSVVMISRVTTENVSYVPLVTSIDSEVRDYVYIVEVDGDYAASFSTSQPRIITIQANTPLLLANKINELTSRANVLDIENGNIPMEQGSLSSSNGKPISITTVVRSSHIGVSGITIRVNPDYYIRGIYYYGADGSFKGTNPSIPANLDSYKDDKIGTDNIASYRLCFNRKDGADILPTENIVDKEYSVQFSSCLKKTDVVNELMSTSEENPLSAKQGMVLNQKIEAISDGTTIIIPSIQETVGYFIGAGGAVGQNIDFCYTEKFYVEKGKTITVIARGYSRVAIISKVVTEGVLYTPVVLAENSDFRKFTYVADESGYYACSYSMRFSRSVTISATTINVLSSRIDALEATIGSDSDKVTELEEKTVGATINTLSLTETDGKFINSGGYVGASANFAYTEQFYVQKGVKIRVTARGYLTSVAMISKVITEDSLYSPKVMSIDSDVHTYEYIAEESGYYAASFGTSKPRTIQVISNTPDTLSERIHDNEERIENLELISSDLSQDLYQGIPVVGMIGDSLMSGAGYDPNTGTPHDNIQYAWWKTLERKSGMTYRRFCQGGMSTFTFISNTTYGLPAALTAGNECNLYIIGLEVNDRNNYPNDLGTSADIDLSNPDNNANTYYGNYGKIIQKITAFNPGCKFILFTNPRSDGAWNDAIREVAGMFSNAYLIDLYAMYSQYFTGTGFFNRYKDSSAHYPAMAYKAMAKLLETAIDKCINDNYTDFRDIQYQG